MVYLQNDTDLGHLAHHMEQWRFSHKIPAYPPVFPKPSHGFKFNGPDGFVVQDLRANGKGLPKRPYAIKKGMHGIIDTVQPMRSLVKFLNFRNKTDMKPIECWLPNSMIIVGREPWPGHFEIAYRHESFTAPNISAANGVSGFGVVIATYLRTCMASDSQWVPAAFKRELGPSGENILTITQAMVDALSKAGAYDVFNRWRFPIEELVTNCLSVDESRRSNPKFVIYFILYEDPDEKKHLYVGKTVDVSSRLARYNISTNNENGQDYNGYHHRLRRRCGAGNRRMGILAQFKDEDDYEAHSAIMEQFMVSCLQTYRPGLEALANRVSPHDLLASYGAAKDTLFSDKGVSHDEKRARAKAAGVEHYMIYRDIASQAFEAADWVWGIAHPRSGVDSGVNWNSPLPEKHFSGSYESTLWIKDEIWLADEDPLAPSATYKLSTFTKSKKNIAHYSLCKAPVTSGGMYHYFSGSFFVGPYEKGNPDHRKVTEIRLQSKRCSEDAHIDDVIDGITLPKLYTEYATQIEVLEDFDRQHPASFARLQGINAYQDSMRAKSFAITIHWQDEDSIPRQRYIQHSLPGPNWVQPKGAVIVPGSQSAYMIAIALSHWQYGDPHQMLVEKSSTPEWQRQCASSMFVKVKVYDPTTWTLTFDVPEPLKNIPSEAKVPWDTQKAQILGATYQEGNLRRQLLTIDEPGKRTEMVRQPQKQGDRRTTRKKCDTCYMINNTTCVRKPGSLVCEICKNLGRERCTWSQGCPQSQNTPWDNIDKAVGTERIRNQAFRSLLLDQRPFHNDPNQSSTFSVEGRIVENQHTKRQQARLQAAEEEAAEYEETI